LFTCREDWWDEAGAPAHKEQRDAGGGVTAQDAKVHLVLFVTDNLEVDLFFFALDVAMGACAPFLRKCARSAATD